MRESHYNIDQLVRAQITIGGHAWQYEYRPAKKRRFLFFTWEIPAGWFEFVIMRPNYARVKSENVPSYLTIDETGKGVIKPNVRLFFSDGHERAFYFNKQEQANKFIEALKELKPLITFTGDISGAC